MNNFDNYKLTQDHDEYTKLQMFLNHRLQEKSQQPLDLDQAIQSSHQAFQKDASLSKPMNLDRLRSDIQSKHSDFQKAALKYSDREDLLKAELSRIAKAKNSNESELLSIMSDLEANRISETKALKEKELVSRALKDLDKKNLNALEFQKKIQMKSLKEERDQLQRREEELFKELERMNARLLDDEENIKKAKNEINAGVVTVKNENEARVQMMVEELSNIRGKEVMVAREKREELELQRAKLESEIRKVRNGNVERKNNSGIIAANSILTPVSLQDRKNLNPEIVRENEKWKEDLERLNQMKKAYEEYVKNEPGYDVKPAAENKTRFYDEMKDLVKGANELKPADRARVLGYIKEDIDVKDLNKSPEKSGKVVNVESNPAASYNIANYKLSTEPLGKKSDPINNSQNLFSAQAFEKYKNDAQDKFKDDRGNIREKNQTPNLNNRIPVFGQNEYPRAGSEDLFKGSKGMGDISGKYGTNQGNGLANNGTLGQGPSYPYGPYGQPFPYGPYNPYDPYNPYYPYNQTNPNTFRTEPNEETQKLKKELKSLKKQLNQPKPVPLPFPAQLDYLDQGDLPEEKLLVNLLNQEQQDLHLLSNLRHDPELYQAKMQHFKEMAAIRSRMEASLQELTLQRMRKNLNKDEIIHNKRLAEDLYREELRKQEILSKLMPEKLNKNYSPDRGLLIGWELVTGVPQKFRKIQLAYGVYERGETRLEPRLVVPSNTEPDPFNSLALRCKYRDVQDVKRLPPILQIVAVIEVQGIDTAEKVSIVGWTAMELFNLEKAVAEGYWKLPVYKPPTLTGVYMGDIKGYPSIPNSFVFLRIFAADNAPKYPSIQDLTKYRIPQSHLKELELAPADRLQSRSLHPDQVFAPNSIIPSRISSHLNSHQGSRHSQRAASQQGLMVRLETLSNFKSRSHLKFKLTIIRNSEHVVEDRGGFCIWTSEAVNTQNADVSILNSSRASHSRNENLFNPEIHINRSTQFLKDFVGFQDEIRWEDDIVLIVEVLERNSRKLSVVQGGLTGPVDDYFLIAWTLYVVSDSERKKLNLSTVELDLFKPPIPEDLSLVQDAERVPGSIRLTVQDLNGDLASQLRQSKTPSKFEPFLESLQPQWDDGKLFQKGDGIDIYIDSARFLPDNTSCCKIIVKALTNNIETVGNAVAGLAELSSQVYSPVFGFRTELRTPTFDPTSTLVITLVTIDAAHNEVRIVGYSAINLFLHKYRKTQPDNANEEDFILNSGAFQLPIYCQEPFRTKPFSLENFTRLEIIPCATLLVRIRDAPKAQQGVRVLSIKDVPKNEWYIRGVIVPPPKYETRAYNTSFCMPNSAEREIYLERASRKGPTVAQATVEMMKSLGGKLDGDDDEIMEWIDQKLNIDTRTPIIDLKYSAAYSKKLGFKVSVDALHHLSGLMPVVALISTNPPASLYTQSIISQDVHVFDKYDWNSFVDTPTFLDGFQTFKNIDFNENLHVIVDIRQVNLDTKDLKPLAWTIIPVFYEDGYVRSGIYQIPLFAGQVPSGLLTEMTAQDPWNYLVKASEKSGGPKYFQNSSLLFRIIDAQREGHFSQALDLNRLDYSYIPKSILSKVSYNSAAYQRGEDGNRLNSVIKGGISPVNYMREVHDIVVTTLDLPHF